MEPCSQGGGGHRYNSQQAIGEHCGMNNRLRPQRVTRVQAATACRTNCPHPTGGETKAGEWGQPRTTGGRVRDEACTLRLGRGDAHAQRPGRGRGQGGAGLGFGAGRRGGRAAAAAAEVSPVRTGVGQRRSLSPPWSSPGRRWW